MEQLDAAQIVVPGVEVRVLERCGSTNSVLLAEASRAPVLLAAECQTAGRGRRGRRWHSAEGALTFSLARLLHRPARELAAVSLVAGVATAKALRALGVPASLKWPNDLLHAGRKLGGILVETRGGSRVVVGVGIDYLADPALPARVRRPLASIADVVSPPPSRNRVIGSIARALMAALEAFERKGFGAVRPEWLALDAYAGQRLRVRLADGRTLTGIAAGLAEDGGLRLQTRSGLRAIRSGTVRLLAAQRAGGGVILAIDAGNSRVKWGWLDPATPQGPQWSSIASVSLIEFAASSDHVNPFSITHESPDSIVISNVAGDGAKTLLVNWTSIFDAEPLWLRGEAERCGVKSRYERPEQLGPDRWAALVAARGLHGAATLVVNAGTATTIDMLGADGTFLGGAILPGAELMRFVLHEHTGRLPLEEGVFRDMPRNTVDAIETGCRHAQAGAIERMYRTFRELDGNPLCIVSGGAGRAIVDELSMPRRYVQNLVLDGLARIALDERKIALKGELPMPAELSDTGR